MLTYKPNILDPFNTGERSQPAIFKDTPARKNGSSSDGHPFYGRTDGVSLGLLVIVNTILSLTTLSLILLLNIITFKLVLSLLLNKIQVILRGSH